MTEQLHVVPLALTMVMGPQIATSVFLVTSTKPVKNSLAYIAAVLIAAALGLAIWFAATGALGIDPKEDDEGPSTADYVVAGLLAVLAIRVFLRRGEADPPKWMSKLQTAEPRYAFALGFLLILLMPTDIAATIATASYLTEAGLDWLDGWPLVAATTSLIALPFAAYLVLGERAKRAMPGVREWMTTNRLADQSDRAPLLHLRDPELSAAA